MLRIYFLGQLDQLSVRPLAEKFKFLFPLKDQKKLPGRAFIFLAFIGINIYVFYLQLIAPDIREVFYLYGLVPAQLSFSDPESLTPLITSQFLHGGWLHLISNVWFLAVFGPNIERAWGSVRFFFYYLLAGAMAGVVQLIFTTRPDIPIVGASGAIAGILGAYLVYFPKNRITSFFPLGFIPLFIAIPAGVLLLYWFGLQVLGGLASSQVEAGGVAFFAHIGGFLTGVILATANKPRQKIKRYTEFH